MRVQQSARTMQQQALADKDAGMARLGKQARMVTAAAQSGDMDMAQSLYTQMVPEAQQTLGKPVPPQLSPDFIPHLQAIADAYDPQAKADFIKGQPGDVFLDPRTGKPAFSIPAAAPKDSSEIATLKALQGDPQLMATYQRLHQRGEGGDGSSALQKRIALAQSMGATPDQIKSMVLGSASQGAPPPIPGDESKQGDAYLSTIDPQQAAQVKALAEGRMAFPTGTALKSPYWQQMLSAVSQYDPSFDAVNYNARSGTRKAFTSGKEAQTVNSLNTVAEHLGALSDAVQNLNNSSFQPYNAAKNKVADLLGDKDIATFNTTKKAVADEVAKVWRATGGSEADIQENLKNLSGSQSPEQLNAAIGTLTRLISGKVSALQDQYKQGMGTTKQVKSLVSPEAQKSYRTVLKRAGMDAPALTDEGSATLSNDSDPLGLLK